MNKKDWSTYIFDPAISFSERCREAYQFQKGRNRFYSKFSEVLGYAKSTEIEPDKIPLLPIRAFKQGKILTEGSFPEIAFKSSGTGSMEQSIHYVHDTLIYKQAINRAFYTRFPKDKYALLCHLPGYNENPDSSLIWMMKHLISEDKSGLSTFRDEYAMNPEKWEYQVKKSGKITLLFGAAFGLIDLIEGGSYLFKEPVEIIETGGMKTYRREITKKELRNTIAEYFQVPLESIHSEYGMCELLSQMYALGSEWFTAPEWVQVTIRDPENPGRICSAGEEGKIGIIDLANIYSCPFILTEDRGVADESGRFKVLGRWNHDNPRGCNFLIDRD